MTIPTQLTPLIRVDSAANDRCSDEWYAHFATLTGTPDIPASSITPAADQTIAAGYGAYAPDYYEIASGTYLECGDGAIMEIG